MRDDDLMPFGKFAGVKMANVPASYLLYIYDKNYVSLRQYPKVFGYILDNMDVLKQETK